MWQDFIIVNCLSPYNAILGRPILELTLEDPREIENNKLLEEVTPISIHPNYPDRHIMIGTELIKELQKALVEFLKKNYDVLTWSQGNVLRIDLQFSIHKLFTNLDYSPIC